jgi:hypothetical protein
MAPKSDPPTKAPTAVFHYYTETGQKACGWLNPKQAKIRNAAKRARMRSQETEKRDYARPQESWQERRRQIKKTD